MYKVITLAVALACLVVWSACESKKPFDAKIEKHLVGGWVEEYKEGGKTIYEYKKDGTVECVFSGNTSCQVLKVTVSGTWKVKDGYLFETVEKCDPPLLRNGFTTRDKVLSINEKTVKFKDEDGKVIEKKRIKE